MIVGTGPGAFTGLRVGLATAKAIAHELGVPIAGVSTAEALLAAATPAATVRSSGSCSCCRPDRTIATSCVTAASAVLLPGGAEPDLAEGEVLVAVDLDGSCARGRPRPRRDGPRRARPRRSPRLGAAPAGRGAATTSPGSSPSTSACRAASTRESGEVAWSRDPR